MIDQVLALIDRLKALIEYREKRADSRFQDIYQPLFDELLTVHRDHVEFFLEVHDQLGALYTLVGRNNWGEIRSIGHGGVRALEYLKKRRTELEAVRGKLRALAQQLEKRDLGTSDNEFVSAIGDYFSSFNTDRGDASLGPQLDPDRYRSHFMTLELELEDFVALFESEDPVGVLRPDIHPLISEARDCGLDARERGIVVDQVYRSLKELHSDTIRYVQVLRYRWSIVCEKFANQRLASSPHV